MSAMNAEHQAAPALGPRAGMAAGGTAGRVRTSNAFSITRRIRPAAEVRWLTSHLWRGLLRVAWRAEGTLQRWTGGWRALTLMLLVGVIAALVFAPASVSRVVVVGAAGTGAFVLGVRCRKQVIVEPFIDYTGQNGKAADGLAMLLISELDRLRRNVEADEVPATVGIERVGGFGRGKERQKEAARFLTASSDGLSDALQGAVSSDANVGLGPVTVPVGPLLALSSRLVRGSRLTGGLHRTGADGAMILTAQLAGGPVTGSWRVDARHESEAGGAERECLDAMVQELACRVFTDIAFQGSGHWRAVRAFAEYVPIYRDSHHARTLREAEHKLLDALAEDASFGLAYYNLGVVHTRLAHGARLDDPAPVPLTSAGRPPRDALVAAHRDAARVAFWNAIEKDPRLWQAHYALAVTQYQAIDAITLGERPPDRSREQLEQVVRGCSQALELCPSDAHAGVVNDLLGMASVRLGTAEGITHAVRAHRTAVAIGWKELRRAERLACAHPGTHDGRVQQARDNAAAALHNLGLAYAHRAMLADLGAAGDHALADHILAASIRLARALPESAAASCFERGTARESQGDSLERASKPRQAASAFKAAADAYRQAADVKVTEAEYAACHARALARYAAARTESNAAWGGRAELHSDIDAQARRALRELAPALRRSVAPLTPAASDNPCMRTLNALRDAYVAFGDTDGVRRAGELAALAIELSRAGRLSEGTTPNARPRDEQLRSSIATLQALRGTYTLEETSGTSARGPGDRSGGDGEHHAFCRDQIDIALARLSAANSDWDVARETLGRLIAEFTNRGGLDAARVVDFGLRSDYARALRHCEATDPSAALKEIEDCLRADPLCLEAHREAARMYYSMGRYEKAVSAWEQALSLAPDDAYAHFKVAICRWQLAVLHRCDGAGQEHDRATQLAKAAEHLETSLAVLDCDDATAAAWARVWSGRVALERGHIGQSIVALTGALNGPADVAARLVLGEAELEAGAVDRAQDAFEHCAAALGPSTSGTLDNEWADQLTRDVIWCRLRCGQARCHLAAVGTATGTNVAAAKRQVELAATYAAPLDSQPLRRECDILLAATRACLRRAGATATIPAEPALHRAARGGPATHRLDRVRDRFRSAPRHRCRGPLGRGGRAAAATVPTEKGG